MTFHDLFANVLNLSGVPVAVVALLGTIFAAILAFKGVVVGGLLSYRGALLQQGAYRREMHAIELATKRTAYWIEYLKVSKLANDAETNSYAQAKAKVREALTRIRQEADTELQRLSWGNQIVRSLRKQEHHLGEGKRSVLQIYLTFMQWLCAVYLVVITSFTLWVCMANRIPIAKTIPATSSGSSGKSSTSASKPSAL